MIQGPLFCLDFRFLGGRIGGVNYPEVEMGDEIRK